MCRFFIDVGTSQWGKGDTVERSVSAADSQMPTSGRPLRLTIRVRLPETEHTVSVAEHNYLPDERKRRESVHLQGSRMFAGAAGVNVELANRFQSRDCQFPGTLIGS